LTLPPSWATGAPSTAPCTGCCCERERGQQQQRQQQWPQRAWWQRKQVTACTGLSWLSCHLRRAHLVAAVAGLGVVQGSGLDPLSSGSMLATPPTVVCCYDWMWRHGFQQFVHALLPTVHTL
jgi:hypothetical protein